MKGLRTEKTSIARAITIIAMLAVATTASWPSTVHAATILNPQNPGNFSPEGQQTFTPGTVLRLTDTSSGDFIVLYANDADAAAGIDVDLVATFQVMQWVPNNAEVSARLVINDGVSRSAIAACAVISGVRGIGLMSQGDPSNPATYPVFVPVDWLAPVTVTLRRYGNGDAELIEINGVAPNPRALLTADLAPVKTRSGSTVEFGTSIPPECTVDYFAFRSERAVTDVPLGEYQPGEMMISAFPNPTTGSLAIAFAVPRSDDVHLAVYDISGRLIRTLWSGQVAGETRSNLTWDGRDDAGRDVAAGAYFARLSWNGLTRTTERVTVVR